MLPASLSRRHRPLLLILKRLVLPLSDFFNLFVVPCSCYLQQYLILYDSIGMLWFSRKRTWSEGRSLVFGAERIIHPILRKMMKSLFLWDQTSMISPLRLKRGECLRLSPCFPFSSIKLKEQRDGWIALFPWYNSVAFWVGSMLQDAYSST